MTVRQKIAVGLCGLGAVVALAYLGQEDLARDILAALAALL